MKTLSLNGIWRLQGKPQYKSGDFEIFIDDATVPGCAQLELSRKGIIPEDIYMGENILETEQYEDWEWVYSRSFVAPEERTAVYLVFRGVDCFAEYFLNGEKIGESDNSFIPFEFEIGDKLRDGENEISVRIKSPVIEAHNKDVTIDAITHCWGHPSINATVRRPAHSYGWDIMPRAVTSGIWRDVLIEVRDDITFSQFFFDCTNVKNPTFIYDLKSKWEDFRDVEIELCGRCKDSEFSVRRRAALKADRFSFEISDPKLWWPYGYGEPNLYDVEMRIYSSGKLIHEKKTRIGLRNVRLERTDELGCFRIVVNGNEIMCKGTNWVPMDAFHCRDRERYPAALELLKDVGCNTVRCWGGNVYEDHEFFDFCDENGIMVWQDFSMACMNYPETEEFCRMIYKEAESVVREYRHHPSIVLWAGDNEVDEMFMSSNGRMPSTNVLTRKVLPHVISLNDIGRPYLESSPYYADKTVGRWHCRPEAHLWGPRDYFKSPYYKDSTAHFVSEVGYHGCPSLESLKKFITPEKLWPYHDNSEWILHSSDQLGDDGRIKLLEKQVREFFGVVPTDPEDFILASQICQAEAVKYFIERMRTHRPDKSGIIWWNLIDGWPQISDAVVDYYYDKKLAYDFIKASQIPFIIAGDSDNGQEIRIVACNDTLVERRGSYKVVDVESGRTLSEGNFTSSLNSCTQIASLPIEKYDHGMLAVVWKLDDGTVGYNHYLLGNPCYTLEEYSNWLGKYKEISK